MILNCVDWFICLFNSVWPKMWSVRELAGWRAGAEPWNLLAGMIYGESWNMLFCHERVVFTYLLLCRHNDLWFWRFNACSEDWFDKLQPRSSNLLGSWRAVFALLFFFVKNSMHLIIQTYTSFIPCPDAPKCLLRNDYCKTKKLGHLPAHLLAHRDVERLLRDSRESWAWSELVRMPGRAENRQLIKSPRPGTQSGL